MSFSVNTNIGALQAYQALSKVNADTQKAQLRLATMKKINSVADDTSGYSVGKQLEAQVLKQQSQLNNISSAQNYLSTAESALQQINDKLNQIQAKTVDSADPLKDKVSIANDIKTLAGEISSILSNTKINGADLLASASASTATFDISGSSFTADFSGASYLNSADTATKTISDYFGATGTISTGSFTDTATAATYIALSTTMFGQATNVSSVVRSTLGRIGNEQQTLTSRQSYLNAAITNSQASISNLFDADMAAEQLNATKGQIGQQIATSMLSQMNTAPQNLLSLFR